MATTAAYRLDTKKFVPAKIRVHDYLYDSTFVVAGAKDYARAAFKAAMASAQKTVVPVYKTMFSDLSKFPRAHVVLYPNARLPSHMDRSFEAAQDKMAYQASQQNVNIAGQDRFKFFNIPKVVVQLSGTFPSQVEEPRPPTPEMRTGPVHKGVQTKYRESSAQTRPWQPAAKISQECTKVPEVLFLDKLEWGPGTNFRTGNLPVDIHTTEVINKMRHARIWQETLKRRPAHCTVGRDGIIEALETQDWIFREAEIDELQNIRMELLARATREQREKRDANVRARMERLWTQKCQYMKEKMKKITLTKNRELRKLASARETPTRASRAAASRRSRGAGDALTAHVDRASAMYAPLARDGLQARSAHADIVCGLELPDFEEALQASVVPSWTSRGPNLQRTLSGHQPKRDPRQLCERETRWTEEFLQKLHADLKKTRLNTGRGAGPCRLLQVRRRPATPRPDTPRVSSVSELEEQQHQAALTLQRLVRGRAVQCMMYEGRCKARELISELKSSYGLDEADRARVAALATTARNQVAQHDHNEAREMAIDSMVEELQGGTLSTALDFLEKELWRLRNERKQHAYVLIALREKMLREAAEAGRRQKEVQRRKEHDELFRQVMGTTGKTVDSYLADALAESTECAAEQLATACILTEADALEARNKEFHDISHPLGSYELVSQLVHHVALPVAHRDALRHTRTGQISVDSELGLRLARDQIFGCMDNMVDQSKDKPAVEDSAACERCGRVCHGRDVRRAGTVCVCWPSCPVDLIAKNRADPRWKKIMRPAEKPVKEASERYPIEHEIHYMLDEMVADAVDFSQSRQPQLLELKNSLMNLLTTKLEVELDIKQGLNEAMERAIGTRKEEAKAPKYHHFMMSVKRDALHRSEIKSIETCPKMLPSQIRAAAEGSKDVTCLCHLDELAKPPLPSRPSTAGERLSSQLQALEEMKTCKCDKELAVNAAEADDAKSATDQSSTATDEEHSGSNQLVVPANSEASGSFSHVD